MASKAYLELLRDPRWQRKRLEIMQRDDFACRYCSSADKTLSVHHRYYLDGRKPWEYDDGCLVTLCEGCHARVTNRAKRLREAMRALDEFELERVLGYVEGIVCERNDRAVAIDSYEHAVGVAASVGVVVADELLMAEAGADGRVDLLPFRDLDILRARAIRKAIA